MRILHIKVNASLNLEEHQKIRKRIESDLIKGFLITDDVIHVEVLEADLVEVAGEPYEKTQKFNNQNQQIH